MSFFEEAMQNAFKPIKENPIILDFSTCQTLGELHLLLKQKFGLPQYYGENWDALWDCLDGLFTGREDFLVEIHGFNSMEKALHEECLKMLEIFEEVSRETPNIVFKVIS